MTELNQSWAHGNIAATLYCNNYLDRKLLIIALCLNSLWLCTPFTVDTEALTFFVFLLVNEALLRCRIDLCRCRVPSPSFEGVC